MRLVKDGRAVELANEAHIHAYKANGWVQEQAAEQPKAAKPRARKPKAEQ